MNCQIPAAAAVDVARGENPLSMSARYSRSSGMRRRRSSARISGPYLPERSSQSRVWSLFASCRKPIQSSTRSLRVTGRSHLTADYAAVFASRSSMGEASRAGSERPADQAVTAPPSSNRDPTYRRIRFAAGLHGDS